MTKKLTHLTESGEAHMVDVSGKAETERTAVAEGLVRMSREAFAAVVSGGIAKGDVLATARIAGIMAAKKTSELIPLCHPLPITKVAVDLAPEEAASAIRVTATVKTKGPTGVEMEALTAVSVAALTVYDMVKAVDKAVVIEGIRLLLKDGGKSGLYSAETEDKSPSTTTPAPVRRKIGQAATPMTAGRRKPAEIMSATSGPRPPGGDDQRRDHFRKFIVDNHMRVMQWAKDAGLPAGLVYGYLHGRSRRLNEDAEAALAKAARSSVKAVFGGD